MESQNNRLHQLVEMLDKKGKDSAENFLKILVNFEQLQFEITRLYQDTKMRELYSRLVAAGHKPATILGDYARNNGILLN